jgi:hypothetical protein
LPSGSVSVSTDTPQNFVAGRTHSGAWKKQQEERALLGKSLQTEQRWPNSAKLTVAEKADSGRRIRPVSLMDYFYRIRIKANYEDAAMFTDGPQSDSAARALGKDLVALTSANLLVHELRLISRTGKRPLVQR